MIERLFLRTLFIPVIVGAVLAGALGISYLTHDHTAPAIITATPERKFAKPGSVPIGGPFTLQGHTGESVAVEDFRGKYLLVFFGFTYCPDVCPTTLADIARTLMLLEEQSGAVQPLIVSLDPERDTPERLAEYVNAFHPQILGLTGSPAQIAAVAKQFSVYYEKISTESYFDKSRSDDHEKIIEDDYLISHQVNTYLMSTGGEYLTHFRYGTKPEEMADTIRKAIKKFGKSTEGGA